MNVRLAIVLAALCVVAACASLDSWNPKVCESGNLQCTCLDPKINYACRDNWVDQLNDPSKPRPPMFLARDAGTDGDAP